MLLILVLVDIFRAPVQPPPAQVPALAEEPDRRVLTAQILEGVEIAVEAEREEANQCTIWVQVDSPEWESPAGREIHLITSAGEQKQRTDERGQVAFKRVPLEELPGIRIETTLDL